MEKATSIKPETLNPEYLKRKTAGGITEANKTLSRKVQEAEQEWACEVLELYALAIETGVLKFDAFYKGGSSEAKTEAHAAASANLRKVRDILERETANKK